MNTSTRANEIVTSMKSFSKGKYHKDEVIGELLCLEQEIVELTFNDLHAETAGLKIWDVENHLKQMSETLGDVADEELQKFLNGSRELSNRIKGELSGKKGEARAFCALECVAGKKRVLENVELGDGNLLTELDAIVITENGLTIVEVKNTSRDILIDEDGKFYRVGEEPIFDCDIAGKMILKEGLLRRALGSGICQNLTINRIVVFTNSRIKVENRFSGITTCSVGQLAGLIDSYRGISTLTEAELEALENAIRAAETRKEYPADFDVDGLKRSFATVMAKLEEASAKADKTETHDEPELAGELRGENGDDNRRTTETGRGKQRWHFAPRHFSLAGNAAAVLTFAAVTAIELIGKGGVR